jgi:fermentation-respiration switch protein FrsA (DUF1100 family)
MVSIISSTASGFLMSTPWLVTLPPWRSINSVGDVDLARLALVGWGLGGGVVIAEASEDHRVRAVACLNGIGDGTRSTRAMHDEASWSSLLRRIEADRARRTSIGRSEITDPWDIVRLDLDGRTDGYVEEQLYQAPGFGTGVTLESAEYLLRFAPERMVARLAPRPLLIVHGAQNELHKPIEARSMFDNAGEPKRLELLENSGHTEWMFDDNPTFKRVVGLLEEFLETALAATPAPCSG